MRRFGERGILHKGSDACYCQVEDNSSCSSVGVRSSKLQGGNDNDGDNIDLLGMVCICLL